MAQPSQPISPLRQRMIEGMRIRKLAPKTQSGYIRAAKKLTEVIESGCAERNWGLELGL